MLGDSTMSQERFQQKNGDLTIGTTIRVRGTPLMSGEITRCINMSLGVITSIQEILLGMRRYHYASGDIPKSEDTLLCVRKYDFVSDH